MSEVLTPCPKTNHHHVRPAFCLGCERTGPMKSNPKVWSNCIGVLVPQTPAMEREYAQTHKKTRRGRR